MKKVTDTYPSFRDEVLHNGKRGEALLYIPFIPHLTFDSIDYDDSILVETSPDSSR